MSTVASPVTVGAKPSGRISLVNFCRWLLFSPLCVWETEAQERWINGPLYQLGSRALTRGGPTLCSLTFPESGGPWGQHSYFVPPAGLTNLPPSFSSHGPEGAYGPVCRVPFVQDRCRR